MRALAGSPLAELVPSRDAAFATVALYLGMQMLTARISRPAGDWE